MPRYLNMTSELAEYTAAHSIPASEAGRRLVVETTRLFPEVAMMQVDPVQGAFLAWLVKLTGARRILEIGTFTGMSSLHMAEALGEDGEITLLRHFRGIHRPGAASLDGRGGGGAGNPPAGPGP